MKARLLLFIRVDYFASLDRLYHQIYRLRLLLFIVQALTNPACYALVHQPGADRRWHHSCWSHRGFLHLGCLLFDLKRQLCGVLWFCGRDRFVCLNSRSYSLLKVMFLGRWYLMRNLLRTFGYTLGLLYTLLSLMLWHVISDGLGQEFWFLRRYGFDLCGMFCCRN